MDTERFIRIHEEAAAHQRDCTSGRDGPPSRQWAVIFAVFSIFTHGREKKGGGAGEDDDE